MDREEQQLLDQLRKGDEDAFATLVERYHLGLVRVAEIYVRDHAAAEDVTQETWAAIVRGIDRFEGRSSLKTWLYSIAANRARTRARTDGRSIPFSDLSDLEMSEPSVEPDRFISDGHWRTAPQMWADETLETHLLSQELGHLIRDAIAHLPDTQRIVITLRDIEGWETEEICNFLHITETNQRVLLHRARSTVRRTLENYLRQGS